MSMRALSRGDHNNPVACANGRDIAAPQARRVVVCDSSKSTTMPPKRILIHPSFEANKHGRGYYKYDQNPLITRGFGFHPIRRKDVLLTKTGAGNVSLHEPWQWADCIIEEVWVGQSSGTSTISSMYWIFREYYITVPAAGRYVGWCPFDRSWNRYHVEILDVRLGPADRDTITFLHNQSLKTFQDTFLTEQLTLVLKVGNPAPPPRGSIVFEGE